MFPWNSQKAVVARLAPGSVSWRCSTVNCARKPTGRARRNCEFLLDETSLLELRREVPSHRLSHNRHSAGVPRASRRARATRGRSERSKGRVQDDGKYESGQSSRRDVARVPVRGSRGFPSTTATRSRSCPASSGEAGGLPQGHAAHLSRSGAGELRGIAAGSNTLIRWFVASAAHSDRVRTRRVWCGAPGAVAGAETARVLVIVFIIAVVWLILTLVRLGVLGHVSPPESVFS